LRHALLLAAYAVAFAHTETPDSESGRYSFNLWPTMCCGSVSLRRWPPCA